MGFYRDLLEEETKNEQLRPLLEENIKIGSSGISLNIAKAQHVARLKFVTRGDKNAGEIPIRANGKNKTVEDIKRDKDYKKPIKDIGQEYIDFSLGLALYAEKEILDVTDSIGKSKKEISIAEDNLKSKVDEFSSMVIKGGKIDGKKAIRLGEEYKRNKEDNK